VDNISAVLEHSDRVDEISLIDIDSSSLEKLLAVMQEPFPELTYLRLKSFDEMVPVLPSSFLGGSAPRLRFLGLDGVPFPGLPKLLLSTTHLVYLQLENIPHSGYISPEALPTALSTLTSLESLFLQFQSPRSHPDRESRRPPPSTRSSLPVLTHFFYKGVTEYLEDLVARIDAPRLNSLYITFFNQIIFETPQFVQCISRTSTFRALEKAHVSFGAAMVNLSLLTSGSGKLTVKIPCRELDWQVSSMEQVFASCLPPLSTLVDLYIYQDLHPQPEWQDNVENALWLELLHPFTAVRNLYISEQFAPRIVPALQELVGGRTTELLPTLQSISLERLQPSGPVQEAIGKFVAARQLSGHPIAISRWDREQDK
jgi:hypothetical protein